VNKSFVSSDFIEDNMSIDDLATYQEDVIRKGQIEEAIRKDPGLKVKGCCYECDTPVPALFCDEGCRETFKMRVGFQTGNYRNNGV
jgi:hypothetical protein